MSNVISVSVFDKAEIKEDQKTEFKRSIFIDPESHNPGFRQMMTIAETLAAFMNADGGMLYVGIGDDKSVYGIADDLCVLANQASSVVARTVHGNDETFTYAGTEDKYELKIRAIVKAFLSPNASSYLGSVNFANMGKKRVCRIEAKPCRSDDYVYAFHKYGIGKPEIAEIYKRFGNQKRKLEGVERDEFVTQRVKSGFSAQLEAVRASAAIADGSAGSAAVVAAVENLLEKLEGKTLAGKAIAVTGGHPFSKEAIMAAKKPKSLAWEGSHYTDVESWQELVLKVLEKAQELSAEKFDAVAEDKTLKRYFVRIQKPRERHSDCFPTRFGTTGNIRVKKSIGNKTYLWREDMALRKILVELGVDVSKFMFVAV